MDYTQPAACLDLLRKLHPIDFRNTHVSLSRIVHGLLAARPAPNQHLEVLEAARDTLNFVQGEMARAYSAHPLPPGRDEDAVLAEVVGLWQAMAESYAAIADADATERILEDQRALLAQRRVAYAGQALVEYFRAHRELPTGLWGALHASYRDAARDGLARIRVADALNDVWHAQSPHEAYVAILLVELANPYGRSERELNWVMRWAQRFAPYCALETDVDTQKPNVYGVDIAGDGGLRPLGLLPRTPTLMRFDGSNLATQIQAVLAQFKRGVKPASLGLGEDCSTSASARLLLSLYRPWGLSASGRRFPRRAKAGQVELTGDWLAIGFALKDYVSSLIAGVVSAFEQPYRPGDWIELDGHYGEVVHVGMRTVALVTADDDTITVPHLKLWSSAVRNANNGSPVLQCAALFHVHPEHDARRARAALEDVAMTSPYLYFDAPVTVVVQEQTWGTQYMIRAYPVDPRQQFRFVSDLTVRGREALSRVGARPLLPQVSLRA